MVLSSSSVSLGWFWRFLVILGLQVGVGHLVGRVVGAGHPVVLEEEEVLQKGLGEEVELQVAGEAPREVEVGLQAPRQPLVALRNLPRPYQ
jgi:hypothetical protein